MNLQRAIEIAVEAHREQTDKAGAPYLLHPLRVMMSLETENERIVGVLHDVVEDTSMTDKTLRHIFNDTVADLVKELTVPKRVKHKKKYVLAKAKKLSPMARLIKLNDALDNLDDLSTALWPEERKASYEAYLTRLIKKLSSV